MKTEKTPTDKGSDTDEVYGLKDYMSNDRMKEIRAKIVVRHSASNIQILKQIKPSSMVG